MNTTEFIEATRQLCADLDAKNRYIDDLEAELRILRAALAAQEASKP